MYDYYTQTELKTLLEARTLVVASFTKTSCGICHLVDYMFFDLMRHFQYQFIYVKIDIEQQPELANKFDIIQTPTISVLHGQDVHLNLTGIFTKQEYKEVIGKMINTTNID